jgi:serralysin
LLIWPVIHSGHASVTKLQSSRHIREGDLIDLSEIDANTLLAGDQDFRFIGTKGFHDKAGELRYVTDKSNTWVQGDVDGDGKADFMIHLDDKMVLKAGHFDL